MSEPASVLPHTTLRPAKLRPLKQFGRDAGKHVRRDLLDRVHAGDVLYARRLTHSRTVIVLHYAGEELAFIYSSHTKRILSFLQPGALETEDWRRSQVAARKLFPRSPEGY